MSSQMYGDQVYRIGNGTISAAYSSEKIKSIEIRASRLLHGAFSWIVTLIANLLTVGTNDPIEHWWLIIQTDSAFYTIQRWINGPITMQRNKSRWQANQVGLYCAGKQKKSDHWSKKTFINKQQHKNLAWLVKQLQIWKFGEYSFCNANCQDFTEWVYRFIMNPEKSQNGRYPCTALLGIFPVTGRKKLIYK